MFQVIFTIISIVAIVVSFFSIIWGWIILAVSLVLMLAQVYITKVQYRAKPQPELSVRANELFKRYAHFYMAPFGSRDFGSAADTLAIAGIIIAIIGLFYHFWWGLPICIVNLISEKRISRFFNPGSFITSKSYQNEHNEIVALIESRMN